MITNKSITKIIAVIMAITVCLCLAAIVFADELEEALGGTGVTMEYESALFNTDEPMTVNIIIDDGDWEDMLANATTEEYHQCDVEINGETISEVGIRTKGNTSLTTIAADPSTNRYSFKLEFDQYVSGQTCYGLDKLVLNNNYADATNMKEALVYDMYQYLGVDASLYNYAKIYVNDEYWGLYLALEAVEDSFMLRNYGTEDGELYKPENMNIGGMNEMGDVDSMTPPTRDESFDFSPFGTPPTNAASNKEATTGNGETTDNSAGISSAPADMDDFDFSSANFDGFSMGGSGANLNYTDDDLDSYSTIWEGEVTDSSKSDHRRVVTALKNISEGNDLETYMDIDNLLKYMVVHTFSVNEDSLSGVMAHNYYLYEYDSQLNILPWDYNLAFGGMNGMGGTAGNSEGATSVVNSAIDEAFAGTNFFDTLMANDNYHKQYYSYFAQLVEDYVAGGGFDEFYERTRSQIDSLVETDPNAFYTYDEYLTACETFYELVQLRGESISGQLDGSIPSTESEQRYSDALIDASHLDLSVMGSMSMGNMGMSFSFGDTEDAERAPEASTDAATATNESTGEIVSFSYENDIAIEKLTATADAQESESFDPSEFSGGELPNGVDPSQFSGDLPEDFDPSQFSGTTGGTTSENADTAQSESSSAQNTASQESTIPEMPSNFSGGNMPDMNGTSTNNTLIQNLITYGACLILLLASLIFAKCYKRKPRKR